MAIYSIQSDRPRLPFELATPTTNRPHSITQYMVFIKMTSFHGRTTFCVRISVFSCVVCQTASMPTTSSFSTPAPASQHYTMSMSTIFVGLAGASLVVSGWTVWLVGSLAEWYTEMNLMCDTVQSIMDSARCKSWGQEQIQYYQSY